MTRTKIIILAAGKGKRMNNQFLPKVLVPLAGQPLIRHLLVNISAAGIDSRPVIVVGQLADLVKAELGSSYDYAMQTEQLGTGHAVASAKQVLQNQSDNIMVLYGDMPMLSPETIKNLASSHCQNNAVITMATFTVPDYNLWRAGFYGFGRVIRNSVGSVEKIIEKKDATPEQLEIKELNPSYFVFQADWLWQNLDNLKNNNAQQEYYLTDLVGIAKSQGKIINTVVINAKEALGVNTQEQLTELENLLV